MTNDELQTLVESISLTYFNRTFEHRAFFNSRLKTTGGRYHLASHDIDFNQKILTYFGEDTFIGVIKHELCHYHLHLMGRGYQHKDRDFKQLLNQTGGLRFVPDVRELDGSIKYNYQCDTCGSTIHRMRKLNTRRYGCAKCKRGRFHLVG